MGLLGRGQIKQDMGRKLGFFSKSVLFLMWSKITVSPGSWSDMQRL